MPTSNAADLLTDRQRQRLAAMFEHEEHAEVEVTRCLYQGLIAAYRHPDRAAGYASRTASPEVPGSTCPVSARQVFANPSGRSG